MDWTPQHFGLHHDKLRPNQLDSILWCLGLRGAGILEAPTGSGKSALSKAVSSQRRVIALCQTKSLQQENYGDTYGADVLFGRANYPCAVNRYVNADECHYDDVRDCPRLWECEYHQRKELAKASSFASLNLDYFLTSYWPRKGDPETTLFCDEAHLLPDKVLDYCSCTISDSDRRKFDLPKFPIIKTTKVPFGVTPAMVVATGYLEAVSEQMKNILDAMGSPNDASAQRRKEIQEAERFAKKIDDTIDAFDSRADYEDWFVRSGPTALKRMGEHVPGFIARPLTSRYHAPRKIFVHGATVLMSATIGDPETFARELGVSKDFQSRVVPHQYDPSVRPIYMLDVPKLSYKSKEPVYQKQAQAVASAILDQPPEWSGLLLVTRKSEASALAARLGPLGLQDRLWIMPGWDGTYTPTNEQVQMWNEQRTRQPNSICITWSLWEGYNGLDEQICIVMKIPFSAIGDPYERARMEYDPRFYRQRAAWQLEQGCGRTRRGRVIDYDLGGIKRGFVAIADGNLSGVQHYLSENTRNALVKY